MKRYGYSNRTLEIKKFPANLTIQATGKVYQTTSQGLRKLNCVDKQDRGLAVELLSGYVVHLAMRGNRLWCIEDLPVVEEAQKS